MDAKTFYDALNEKIRKTGSNQASHIYATRARDVLTAAYDLYSESPNCGQVRKTATAEQIEKANKLIALGVAEAILGRGRFLLQR